MNSKNNILTTVIIAAVVALIVSLIVVANNGPQLAPKFNRIGNATNDSTGDLSERLPDLIINQSSVKGKSFNNMTGMWDFKIKTVVKNIGIANANSNNMRLVLQSNSTTFDTMYVNVPKIGKGKFKEINTDWNTTSGFHNLFLQADTFNQVKESNENNNDYSFNFTLP